MWLFGIRKIEIAILELLNLSANNRINAKGLAVYDLSILHKPHVKHRIPKIVILEVSAGYGKLNAATALKIDVKSEIGHKDRGRVVHQHVADSLAGLKLVKLVHHTDVVAKGVPMRIYRSKKIVSRKLLGGTCGFKAILSYPSLPLG